jgi:hypothetical protein
MIKGRFATPADAATVHQISEARRRELDVDIDDVLQAVAVKVFSAAERRKRDGSKRSGKTVELRAKRK